MNGSPREFSSRGRYLKSEGQEDGSSTWSFVDDRFVGNGIFTDAHCALECRRADARVVRGTQVGVGEEVDCDVMRVVLLGGLM